MYIQQGKLAPLFHSTRVAYFDFIVESGFIKPETKQQNKKLMIEPYYTGEMNSYNEPMMNFTQGISLTRDFKFAKNWISCERNVIFEFDQRELKQRFKIKPINYFMSNGKARYIGNKAENESEEFVITNKGIPFNDLFVKRTYIFRDMILSCELKKNHEDSEYYKKFIDQVENLLKYPVTILEN